MIRIALPHILLMCVLLTYICAGAVLFKLLEQNEQTTFIARKGARVAEVYERMNEQLRLHCPGYTQQHTQKVRICADYTVAYNVSD